MQAGKRVTLLQMELRALCDWTFSKDFLIILEQLMTFLSIRGSREAGGVISFSGENHRQPQLSLAQAKKQSVGVLNRSRIYVKQGTGCTSEACRSAARPSPAVPPAILHQSRFPLFLLLFFPFNQSILAVSLKGC